MSDKFTPAWINSSKVSPTSWLVQNLIPEGMTTLIGASPTGGKSWLVGDMVVCVSQGKKFLGEFTTQKRDCLIIDEDSPTNILEERIGRLIKGHAFKDEENPLNKTLFTVSQSRFSFLEQDCMTWLISWVENHNNPLIVVDSLSRSIPKARLQHTEVATQVTLMWNHIKAAGATLVIVHHATLKKKPDLTNLTEDPTQHLMDNTQLVGGSDSCLLMQNAPNPRMTEFIVRPWSRRIHIPAGMFSILLKEDKLKSWARLVLSENITLEPSENAKKIVTVFIDNDRTLTVRNLSTHLAGRLSDNQIREAMDELETRNVLIRNTAAHNRFFYSFNKKILGDYQLSDPYLDSICELAKEVDPTFGVDEITGEVSLF